MSDAKDIKKKKTLSLKLGAKPSIPPSTSIEAGRTVVVAKKELEKLSILKIRQVHQISPMLKVILRAMIMKPNQLMRV